MVTEELRIDSNRNYNSCLVEERIYKQENLINVQMFLSTLGKSTFYGCGLNSFSFTSTDIDELTLSNSTWDISRFRIGEIKSVSIKQSRLVDCKFSSAIIGPGKIGLGTVFKNCIFGKVDFYNIKFEQVRFENCRFVECTFSLCSFDGYDSYMFPEDTTQNRFVDCTLEDTTFDSCHFNGRTGTYGKVTIKRYGGISPSIEFQRCKGTIKLLNTTNKEGFSSKGFMGTSIWSTKPGTALSKPIPAIDTCDEDDESYWGHLVDTSGAWPAVEAVKELKSKAPVRYMSEGL